MQFDNSKMISKNDKRKLSVPFYALESRILKVICETSYFFGNYNYFGKKTNLIPTIFPIILISNITEIYVDNSHFLLYQVI